MSAAAFKRAAEKAQAALEVLEQVADALPEGTDVSDEVLGGLEGAKVKMQRAIAKLEERKTVLEGQVSEIEDQVSELENAVGALENALLVFQGGE
jgi:exonuclease VII small subunit